MNELKPFLEYGSMGILLLVLLGGYQIIGRVLAAFERNGQVVQANTDAIRELKDMKAENHNLLADIRDRLLERPCMIKEKE